MASHRELKAELRKFEASGRVVIPKAYANHLGLQPGDQVLFKLVGGSVTVARLDPSKL